MSAVENRRDVPDLKTGLFLANTQAVWRITKGSTFFSQRLFLTNDNWKQWKELLIPSWDLSVEKLSAAGVHINSTREICLDRRLVHLPPCLLKLIYLSWLGKQHWLIERITAAGFKGIITLAMTVAAKKKTNQTMTMVGRHLVQLTIRLKCLTTNPSLINLSPVVIPIAAPASLWFQPNPLGRMWNIK